MSANLAALRPRILPYHILLGVQRDTHGRETIRYRDPIHDGESFCRKIADETLNDWGMFITDEEYVDLIIDLVEIALRLEKTFDPERNPSYAGYANWVLRRRVTDVGPRKLLGRSGLRIAERSHENIDSIEYERAAERAGHHQTIPTLTSDPDEDRRTDDPRLSRNRDRGNAWANTILGLRAA